ncbi:TPM domain-containing protein [Rothia sp. P7208]|uniref:TPM domain-containing protein n=1 Tax=Rothia sp. P7208 TaxID=3402660 RepID=UPI003AC5C66D
MVKNRIFLRTLLASSVVFLASVQVPAFAEDPMKIPAGIRIIDEAHLVSQRQGLSEEIEQFSQKENMNFYLVLVKDFEHPHQAQAWVKELAQLNNMGANDVVLAVATDSRQAYFQAGSSQVLSEEQLQDIYQNKVFPYLKKSDYQQAAIAAMTAIEQARKGSDGSLGTFGMLGGLAVLGVGGATYYASRKNSRKLRRVPASSYERRTPSAPLPQLRTNADSLLLQADNSIAEAEQELEFARMQYGDSAVHSFVERISTAKDSLQKAFQLQRQLDDDIPDTEEDQRQWLEDIISRCQDIVAQLHQELQGISQLRQIARNAPELIATLQKSSQNLSTQEPKALAVIEQLQNHYTASALEQVTDNYQQAVERLEFGCRSLKIAEEKVSEQQYDQASADIHATQEAFSQAQKLLESVMASPEQLRQAQRSVEDALLLAERDIAEAQSFAQHQDRAHMASAAAGLQSVVQQIRTDLQRQQIDPLAMLSRLENARTHLDDSLKEIREFQEQTQRARESLKHTLFSAQTQVHSASEFVRARRGGVKTPARTALQEAQRYLQQAQQLQHQDPVSALEHAQQAIRLAAEAKDRSSQDVQRFGQQQHGDYPSAMLGGILLGTLLNGGGSSSGNTSFGGGFDSGFDGGFGGFDGPGTGGNF